MTTTLKVIESLEVCENACNEGECEFPATAKKQYRRRYREWEDERTRLEGEIKCTAIVIGSSRPRWGRLRRRSL